MERVLPFRTCDMDWQQRLRDMILAGGALAAAACSASSGGGAVPGEAGPGDALAGDALPDVGFGTFCCNANGDPCCEYLNCGGALTTACSQEMACQADGGTWSLYPAGCSFEAGPGDAGSDGAPGDAAADGDGHD